MVFEKESKRLDHIRALVYEMLLNKEEAWANLSGVSSFASLLAMRRGKNSEIAAIAGLFHDFYFYKTGIKTLPGHNSADAVRPIIRSTQVFNNEEMSIILRAIFYQEDRQRIHGPYEEIIKDAILLQMYFRNTGNQLPKTDLLRIQKVFMELGIPEGIVEAESSFNTIIINRTTEDKRSILADYAETLAGQKISGVPDDERYREICKNWPDTDIYKILECNWCAAFVYYCCLQVGIVLPIRYPNRMYRLAGVGAWLDWALLPETSFFHSSKQEGFTPTRGDIVIFEKLLSDNSHDHIGIVLACDDNRILVAEGNKDNKNYSSVSYRDRSHCILGYIRIDNGYQYHFQGEYVPID